MHAITPRGVELDLNAARPIDAIRVARTLLRTTRVASLATLDPGGYPHCTVTNLIVQPDGVPVFFTASLAIHFRNIAADPRVSVTVADGRTDVMTTPRLTLSGRAEQVPADEAAMLKSRYVERFPKSRLYLGLPDAMLFRVRAEAVQLNGGPAQNANAVTAADLLTDLIPAKGLIDQAGAIILALNGGSAPAQLAAAAGAAPGRWRVSSIDPEGIDLSTSDDLARLWFANPALTRAAFDAEVADLIAR